MLQRKLSLEKNVLIRRQVLTLLQCARSPRMLSWIRRLRSLLFPIIIIPTLLITRRLQLNGILHVTTFSTCVMFVKLLVTTLHLIRQCQKNVRCKCALITFLHNEPLRRAFSYIGVSKLSCKPCSGYNWISTYNKERNCQGPAKRPLHTMKVVWESSISNAIDYRGLLAELVPSSVLGTGIRHGSCPTYHIKGSQRMVPRMEKASTQ